MIKLSKRILTVLAALALALTCSACGIAGLLLPRGGATSAEESTAYDSFSDSADESSDSVPEEPTERAAAPAHVDGSLEDLTFVLEGVQYYLPATYAEFESAGWKLDEEDVGKTFTHGQSTITNLYMGEKQIMVYLENFHLDVVDIKETHVTSVEVTNSPIYGELAVTLPGGITLDSTWDDVLIAYGEPTEKDDNDDTLLTIRYEFDNGEDNYSKPYVLFYLDDETRAMYSISINSEDEPQVETPTYDGVVPEIVTAYKAPTGLGSDWRDYSLRIESDYYRLPAPLQSFLDNGWTLVQMDTPIDLDQVIPAKTTLITMMISLKKGEESFSVDLYNYADTAQPLSNCFITGISYMASYDSHLDIELAGGITPATTRQQLETAYGKPDKFDDEYLPSYDYGEFDMGVHIDYDDETEKIFTMSMHCEPSEYTQ